MEGTLAGMWRTYRKRFLFTQVPIVIVCAVLRFGYAAPWPRVGVFFGMMQIASVVGAWWATRVQRAMVREQDQSQGSSK